MYTKFVEHNDCCKLTADLNRKLRLIYFIYYFLIIPFIDLAIIVVINESNIFYKSSIGSVAFIVIINLFVFNYMSALVSSEAHNSYTILNSIIASKSFKLNLNLKTLTLIERLSGPEIGFYCLDLFPLNNYEFYIFCVNCAKNFILLIDLF